MAVRDAAFSFRSPFTFDGIINRFYSRQLEDVARGAGAAKLKAVSWLLPLARIVADVTAAFAYVLDAVDRADRHPFRAPRTRERGRRKEERDG